MHATRFPNLSITIRKNWSNTIGSVKHAIETVWSADNLANRNLKTKMRHDKTMNRSTLAGRRCWPAQQ